MKTSILVTISIIAISVIGASIMIYLTMPTDNLENDVKQIPIVEIDNTPKMISPKILDDVEYPHVEITPLDDKLNLLKTTIIFTIDKNNELPFGYISGKVDNPAFGYPVIIQIFKAIDGDPVHIAQVDLEDDGAYNYSMRVLSIDDDKITRYFEGEYFVKIMTVIQK